MKKTLLLILMVVSINALAQQISQTVIASSGGNYSAGGFTLTSTVGEMAMINTFTQSGSILTQGFHQGELLFTGIENPVSNGSISIYPNPAGDVLNVHFNFSRFKQAKLHVYDALGQLTQVEKNIDELNFSGNVALQLSTLAPGIYFLNVDYTLTNGEEKTFNSRFIIQR